MPIMRKMNLINAHFWTYLSRLVCVSVFPGHTIRELLSSNTHLATMRVLTVLRHWVTKHPEVSAACKFVCFWLPLFWTFYIPSVLCLFVCFYHLLCLSVGL